MRLHHCNGQYPAISPKSSRAAHRHCNFSANQLTKPPLPRILRETRCGIMAIDLFIWKRIEVVVTSRTRNAVVREGTWVRIPPLPPPKDSDIDTMSESFHFAVFWRLRCEYGLICPKISPIQSLLCKISLASVKASFHPFSHSAQQVALLTPRPPFSQSKNEYP